MPPKINNMLLKYILTRCWWFTTKVKNSQFHLQIFLSAYKFWSTFLTLLWLWPFKPYTDGFCGCYWVLSIWILEGECLGSCSGCILLIVPLHCAQLGLLLRAFVDQVKAFCSSWGFSGTKYHLWFGGMHSLLSNNLTGCIIYLHARINYWTHRNL